MTNAQPIDAESRPTPRIRRTQKFGRRGETLTTWVIWLMLGSTIGAEVLGQTELIGFGFYTLHIVDLPVLLAFIAWGYCQGRRLPQGGILALLTIIIAALVMINFLRGITSDSAAALLWARANLSNVALLMLATTCELSPKIHENMQKALIFSGGALSILTILRLILGPNLFILDTTIDPDMVNDGGRALGSTGAFILALSATVLLSKILRCRLSHSIGKLVLFLFYVAMEIATGQGTATFAMIAMLFLALVLERGPLHGGRVVLGLALILIISIVLSVSLDFDQIRPSSGGAFDIAQRSNNLDTRNTIWDALKLSFAKEPLFDQLFGMPAGRSPLLLVYLSNHLIVWDKSYHSMYYGSLPVMGYVGLSAYITLLIILSIASLINVLPKRAREAIPSYPFAMCIGTAILSYTYEIRLASTIGLFIAIWWYRAGRRASRLRVCNCRERWSEESAH